MATIAVLASGGLDSSLLAVKLSESGHIVYPVYLQHGLHWESVELRYLNLFLAEVSCTGLQALTVLNMPVADLYQSHWSITGKNVPDQTTPDKAVYLPGRNLLLLAKTGVWCAMNNIQTIALAPLSNNPFTDNSDKFYTSMATAINTAIDKKIEIIRPFTDKSKAEVLADSKNLPLGLTFSCIQPIDNKHCGVCNKCAERILAFRESAIEDPTGYHQ